VFTWLFKWALPKTELNNVYAFIGRHGITSYPYDYARTYNDIDVLIENDSAWNLPFVMHNNRKLFFPEHYSHDKIKKDYRALLIEQDIRAAHRYVRSYDELKGKILLDVGAAEGIFSLDTIDYTRQVILFECVDHWQKPLMATFSLWKEKVSVIKKYVGDVNSSDFITLDAFCEATGHDDLFIKMDIEGAERKALAGASKILEEGKRVALSVCTYHRVGDPEYIEGLLKSHGFFTEFSDGLMYWNKRFSKGILRARR